MSQPINQNKLQVTNRLIVQEALARGWDVEVLDYEEGIIAYQIPGKSRPLLLKSTRGPFTSAVDVEIADNKMVSSIFANKAGLLLPDTLVIGSENDAEEFLKKHEHLVVKPIDAAHGNGVSTNVTSQASFEKAYKKAKLFSDKVILQEFVGGKDLRLLFIDSKLAAAAIRKPAEVTGDGKHTITELVAIENASGKRAPNYLLPLNLIDESAVAVYVGDKITYIPTEGEVVQVVGTSNIGKGGYAVDITDDIDPEIVAQGRKLVDLLNPQIWAIDFIWDEEKQKPYFIEMNAGPSFGLHTYPAVGKSRPIAKIFLDWVEKVI